MILLINLDGPEDPGLTRFGRALRQGERGPVIIVTPHLPDGRSGQERTGDRGLRITPHHHHDLFCFSVDGTLADLLPISLNVICPTPPRLIVIGINRLEPRDGSPRATAALLPALRAAGRGFPVLLVEADGPTATPDLMDDAHCAYAAAFARLCRSLPGLRGTVLRLRLPAQLAVDHPPPRFLPFALPGAPQTYRPVRHGDHATSWQLVADTTTTPIDEDPIDDGHPIVGILSLGPEADGQDITDRILSRWAPQPRT